MKLVLIRGPSGTGKSTIAKNLSARVQEVALHETDKFFVNEFGMYNFVASKIGQAHAWNQQQVQFSMSNSVPLVIVSNTFITHWEMEVYLTMAERYKYEVELIRTPGPWDSDVLKKRNKHSVPLETLERQIRRYQPHEADQVWSDMSIFK